MPDGPIASAALGIERSLAGRRWRWAQGDARTGMALAQQLDLPEALGAMLAARGIGVDTARAFLEPSLREGCPDPSRLVDMDAAADRLAFAARTGERVAIFADYDVDGAASATLVADHLEALGARPFVYVPDRGTEGYGPQTDALGRLVSEGASLIVCVDCGTAGEAAFTPLAGLADIVVLDHHKAEGPPPPVRAVVNPNRLDDSSGLGSLCATGVAFLAALATSRTLRQGGFFDGSTEPDRMALLDLVALATVCDMVPLTGPNRVFVTQGLKVMARRGRPGLAALADIAALAHAPDVQALGFALGPRINAAGRIDDCGLGVRLLRSRDAHEAAELAERLDAINRKRQELEVGIQEAAFRQAEEQVQQGRSVLLVSAEDWHSGVVGIVASRLVARYHRPVLVAAIGGGEARGSGRSVEGFDLGAAVLTARQAGLLRKGGGHTMAAGFTAEASALDGLHRFVEARFQATSLVPRPADLRIDAAVPVAGAGPSLAQAIARLAPFGQGNDEPLVAVTASRVVRADRVGRDEAHVRVVLAGEGGAKLKAIAFGAAANPLGTALCSSDRPLMHLCGRLRLDEYRGGTEACLQIVDGAVASG